MNPIDYFLGYIDGIQTLTDDEKTTLHTYCHEYNFNAHTYILRAGDVSDSIYFIYKGLVRAYYNDKPSGNEITSWFIKESGLIFSVNSYVNQSPSFENIVAVEKTTVVAIRKSDIYALMGQSGTYAKMALKLTEHYLQICDERVRSLQYDVKDRYKRFETHYPDLLSRIKKDDLASYLSMCKSSLFNVRGKKQ